MSTPITLPCPAAAPDYPRPQLVRRDWLSLDGPWSFAFDDADAGLAEAWQCGTDPFQRTIKVPFPPESEASGIGDTAPHRVSWYRRELPVAELAALRDAAGPGARLLLHVGAADYRAQVWLDGRAAGGHEGGHTPFTLDLTDLLDQDGIDAPGESGQSGAGAHVLTVRCEDDPSDLEQPRGKQDWATAPHAVWYHRTSGLWRTVWLEAVPALHVRQLHWTSDIQAGRVTAEVALSATPAEPVDIRVELSHDGATLARTVARCDRDHATIVIDLPTRRTEQDFDELLWRPENPVLIGASIELSNGGLSSGDAVESYLGLRSVGVGARQFLLNGKPYYLRSVLEQGYWPESLLAPPGPVALRDEVQLIKDLGFNSVRVHQKIEDPRFFFWCDVLGLAAWAEFPAAYDFTPRAVERTVAEWLEAVRRDRSHPSIVAWVPFNESWGVAQIAHSREQQEFTRGVVALTRALDPTRPVISNDGWEHTDSDLVTIHDYTDSPAEVLRRYGDDAAVERLLRGYGPADRLTLLDPLPDGAEPTVMLSEFGGIKFVAADGAIETWGYSAAQDQGDFERRLRELFAAVHACRGIAGFCYTQLTDTLQEANGLTDADRKPKLPTPTLAAIIANR